MCTDVTCAMVCRLSELESELSRMSKQSLETQSIRDMLQNNFSALASSIAGMQESHMLTKGKVNTWGVFGVKYYVCVERLMTHY